MHIQFFSILVLNVFFKFVANPFELNQKSVDQIIITHFYTSGNFFIVQHWKCLSVLLSISFKINQLEIYYFTVKQFNHFWTYRNFFSVQCWNCFSVLLSISSKSISLWLIYMKLMNVKMMKFSNSAISFSFCTESAFQFCCYSV